MLFGHVDGIVQRHFELKDGFRGMSEIFSAMQAFKLSIDFYTTSIKVAKPEIPQI